MLRPPEKSYGKVYAPTMDIGGNSFHAGPIWPSVRSLSAFLHHSPMVICIMNTAVERKGELITLLVPLLPSYHNKFLTVHLALGRISCEPAPSVPIWSQCLQ